ncbi:hypothetical protein EXS71_00980 [Candidatus Uhrbacteria bacterium]|nr:hypothetical protein [Candidatus Uhrbacteria bacterium]
MKKLISLAGLVVLFGAGCAGQAPLSIDTGSTQPVPSPAVSGESTVPALDTTSTAPVTMITMTAPPAMIDDTWKTYINPALHFSFQWPTKGIYAPRWSVEFTKDNPCGSSSVKEEVKGVVFCHIHSEEGTGLKGYLSDVFATKNGERYILISFTKQPMVASFKADEYQTMLSTIISTFKYDESIK